MIGEAKCTSQKGEKKKPKNQRTMRELTRIDRDWSQREMKDRVTVRKFASIKNVV